MELSSVCLVVSSCSYFFSIMSLIFELIIFHIIISASIPISIALPFIFIPVPIDNPENLLQFKNIKNNKKSHAEFLSKARTVLPAPVPNNAQPRYPIAKLADLLITSVSMSNDVISQIAQYNFQIIRFGVATPIPSGSVV